MGREVQNQLAVTEGEMALLQEYCEDISDLDIHFMYTNKKNFEKWEQRYPVFNEKYVATNNIHFLVVFQ